MTIVLHLYSNISAKYTYREKDVQNQTKSLWSFANHNRDLFLNPLYHGDVRSNDFSGKQIDTTLNIHRRLIYRIVIFGALIPQSFLYRRSFK